MLELKPTGNLITMEDIVNIVAVKYWNEEITEEKHDRLVTKAFEIHQRIQQQKRGD